MFFLLYLSFSSLTTPSELLSFFRSHFADSIPLIGEDRLVRDFFAVKASSLISIKVGEDCKSVTDSDGSFSIEPLFQCSPYNWKDKALILGDAAHAMVPFYGQGMNCVSGLCSTYDQRAISCLQSNVSAWHHQLSPN